MGMQRIKGADPSMNGQGGKQLASFWDLVGFCAYRQLGPDFFPVVREAGKQMGGISFSRSGSSHGLAIDGEGIGGASLAAGPDPGREDLLNPLSNNSQALSSTLKKLTCALYAGAAHPARRG